MVNLFFHLFGEAGSLLGVAIEAFSGVPPQAALPSHVHRYHFCLCRSFFSSSAGPFPVGMTRVMRSLSDPLSPDRVFSDGFSLL